MQQVCGQIITGTLCQAARMMSRHLSICSRRIGLAPKLNDGPHQLLHLHCSLRPLHSTYLKVQICSNCLSCFGQSSEDFKSVGLSPCGVSHIGTSGKGSTWQATEQRQTGCKQHSVAKVANAACDSCHGSSFQKAYGNMELEQTANSPTLAEIFDRI